MRSYNPYKFFWVAKKNLLLFFRSPFQATFVFVVPVLLICILVFVRSKAPREAVTEPVKWPGFDIGNVLAPSYKYLAFAPNVTLYHQIMLSVSISTNLQLIGFKSEEEAVDFFTSRDTRVNKTIGVVVFDSPPTLSVVNYTIRLHSDNQWNTKFLFPLFLTVGPRSNDISASPPNYKDAFLPLQYAIDRAIVNLNCKVNDTFNRLKVTMKRMPFPPYINDGFIVIIQKELAVLLILGFIFPTLHSVRLVLVEKQRRMKEMLKVLGLGESAYWISWLLTNLFIFVLIGLSLSLLLCLKLSENGPILRLSNPFLIFLLLMLYGISVSAFGFALSTFFNSAHTGVALVCTVLIIISLPYPILEEHYNELNLFTKLVACLLPSLAMGFTGLLIGRFESAGLGLQFSSFFTPASPEDNFSVSLVCLMYIFDTIFYLLITYYKSVVWPGKYGIPKPWYFIFPCQNLRKHQDLTVKVSVDNINNDNNNQQTDNLMKNALQTTELPSASHVANISDNYKIMEENVIQQGGSDSTGGDRLLLSTTCEPSQSGSVLTGGDDIAVRQCPSSSQNSDDDYFEREPIGLQVGIAIQQLRKVYSSKQSTVVALSGLTMNIHEGQITVLLGHNGAGKTTTLSILTGMLPPTSGTAYVCGQNILQDIQSVREKIGFCSQHDVLYDTLTVEEHLYLSARLKAVPNSIIKQQVDSTLAKVYLLHKRKKYAKTLSGGMKRRLSIGMALVGDSKVLILDEPTSGLDPEARRQVWDILQAERPYRAILVTTHYMDEADHLGDRIAIMAGGELKCFGSPLFLKAKYGAGYLLSVIKQSSCSPDHVLKQVKQYIPNAVVRSDYGEEIRLLLPLESIDQFAKLFQHLEVNRANLGILNFGVSVTTMGEVFHRVSEQVTTKDSAKVETCCKQKSTKSKLLDVYDENDPTDAVRSSFDPVDLHIDQNRSFQVFLQQFHALIIKRYIFTKRNIVFFLSQIAVPIGFTLFALYTFRRLLSLQSEPEPRLLLSLDPYGDNGLLVSYSNEVEGEVEHRIASQFIDSYAGQFNRKQVKLIEFNKTTGDYEDNLLKEIAIPDLYKYRTKSIIGLVVDTKSTLRDIILSVRAYFQGEACHASPVSLNAVGNGLLRYFTSYQQEICPGLKVGDTPPQIHVANQPLPMTEEERSSELNQFRALILVTFAAFPLASNLLFSASYLASTFGYFPIHEAVTKAKHLQFISGVKLVSYWLSIYAWDICLFSLSIIGILVCFALFNLEQFAVGERFHLLVILFILFMWAVLPQVYLLSRLFRSPTSGLVWLTAINVFTGSIGLILIGLLSIPAIHQQTVGIYLMYFWMAISPSFCLAHGIFALFVNYQFRQICDSLFVDIMCHLERQGPCCLKTCDPFCAYWTKNELSYELGGIGVHLTALLAHGFLYIIFILLLDSSTGRYLKTCLTRVYRRCRCPYSNSESLMLSENDDLISEENVSLVEDIDVRQHRHLVESLPLSRLKEQSSLALCRVSKAYGAINLCRNQLKRPAVDRVSLAILPSECFGLLGANGAGKTTIFRMITGDLEPSFGQIIVAGYDMNKNLRKAQQSLGYCPQFDALLPYLTGYETLQLFGRLRGIKEKILTSQIDNLLYDLKLTKIANHLVSHYSGGERRKLSVAVALVGGTPIVCLDEPTTGVDPVSRKCIWNLLMHYRCQGRTVVLSSHSMEECEALCSRVSIFVNGRIKCLGTCQHLKTRFGHGYSLHIQVMIPTVNTTGLSVNTNSQSSIVSTTSTSILRSRNSTAGVEKSMELNQTAPPPPPTTTTELMIEAVENVSNFIRREFPDARLVDQHQGVLQYHLPTDEHNQICLSRLFHLMETNKAHLGLVNYSISQTTLEQIFIDLTKLQEEPPVSPVVVGQQ